ncbi:hypothetical protein KZ820_06590 [Sphingomonas sp. RRHST34]|uniref:HEAT repeat domain-containing protein n=1 Tax=Sphingomonas citri TaxID=2862499 RepID=A0ABS7BLQ5_9SPHN|nr:hypothetical protein [Sphingomonas citri]MBW6530397.1 hypothetical protein [Sphingomonas citri]
MKSLADRFRNGEDTAEDRAFVESLIKACDVSRLEDVITPYLKYARDVDGDAIVNCARMQSDWSFKAAVITGVGRLYRDADGYDKLVCECLRGNDNDFMDMARLAALNNIGPDVVPMSARVAAILSDSIKERSRPLRDAALVAVQAYLGLKSRDIEWSFDDRRTADLEERADAFLSKWLPN